MLKWNRAPIIELGRQGYEASAIALLQRVPLYAIQRILRKAGMARHVGRHTIDDWTQLEQLYASGMSIADIAKHLGCNFGAVRWQLRQRGIMRPRAEAIHLAHRKRGRGVPDSFHFRELTPDTAWLLGVIFGDGSMDKHGRAVAIASADRDVIDNIIRIVGKEKLTTFHYGNCTTVSWVSRRVWGELNGTWGLIPNKGPVMQFPNNVPAGMLPHFVRGLMDSDGSWAVRRDRTQERLAFAYVSTSERFVWSLRACIMQHVAVSGNGGVLVSRPTKTRLNPLWRYKRSHHDALAIGEWLYRDSTATNRCARKYDLWRKLSVIPARRRPISCVAACVPASLQTQGS